MFASPAVARDFTAHDGASLASAVKAADENPGADTITLDPGNYFPAATLTLSGQLTIKGADSAPGSRLDGSAIAPVPSSILAVSKDAVVTLQSVTVTNGGGDAAAAIDDRGTLAVDESLVAGNVGFGILVHPDSTLTVRNSTLSDNLATGLVTQGTANLVNTTVAYNMRRGIDSTGHTSLSNTIVAHDALGDCTRPVNSSDHSLDGDGSCGVGALAHRDPLLADLAGNGGPTETRALQGGSPAIGAGAACPATDQRGYERSGACDLGAYETGASRPASPSPSDNGSPGGNGSTGSHQSSRDRVRVSGLLRPHSGSPLSMQLIATAGTKAATITIRNARRRVFVRASTISSLQLNKARTRATIKGSARRAGLRHAVRFTLSLTKSHGFVALRMTFSVGASISGRLKSSAVIFGHTAG